MSVHDLSDALCESTQNPSYRFYEPNVVGDGFCISSDKVPGGVGGCDPLPTAVRSQKPASTTSLLSSTRCSKRPFAAPSEPPSLTRVPHGAQLCGGGGALLSGYPRSAVLRALHSAVPRIVSRTPWDVEATQAWTVHILYSLPSTRDTIFYRPRQWLQGHGLWSGAAYASWHVPHTGPCSETCADWCYDFHILSAHTPRGDPSQPSPVGPPARGEGDSAFPLLSVHT